METDISGLRKFEGWVCSQVVAKILEYKLSWKIRIYSILNYIDHIAGRFLSTLCVSARSIATVTTFCGFSSFTIVVTDAVGDAAEDGGGIWSLLPECARSSMVEKLLNVDLSRLEDGDMLTLVSRI